MHVAVDLRMDRVDDRGQVVAEVRAAEPAGEVDVLAPFDVPDAGAFGTFDDERGSGDAPCDVLLAGVLHTRAEVRTLGLEYGEGADVPGDPGMGDLAADGPAMHAPVPDGHLSHSPDTGGSRRSEPSSALADKSMPGAHLGYSSDVIEVVETYLYRPMIRPVMMLVRAAKRLQSGRLDAYLAYMLIALIALIAIVVALA